MRETGMGEANVPAQITLLPALRAWAASWELEVLVRVDLIGGGWAHASVVLPLPDGPQISVTVPRCTPTGPSGDRRLSGSRLPLLPRRASSCGRPVLSGEGALVWRFLRACVAETVGRRSGMFALGTRIRFSGDLETHAMATGRLMGMVVAAMLSVSPWFTAPLQVRIVELSLALTMS